MSNPSRFVRICAGIVLAATASTVLAQTPTMEVYAGGHFYQNAAATLVQTTPQQVTVGPDGFLYISDWNGRLLRYDPTQGTATALPGVTGKANIDLGTPYGAAFDPSGQLFVATQGGLYRVDLAAGVTAYVGSIQGAGHMTFAPDGTLYYVSADDNRVFARSPSGQVTVVAGQGTPGFDGDGGPAVLAHLSHPMSLARDTAGNLYIADTQNSRIRRVDRVTGIITTIAGTGEWDVYNGDNHPGLQAIIGGPMGVVLDAGGNLFISSDTRILRLDATTGLVTSVAGAGSAEYSGDGGPATAAGIFPAYSLAMDAAGNLYFDSQYRVRKVTASTGIISTIVGNGEYVFCGEGVPARSACLTPAWGIDFDAAQNLLITGEALDIVRQVRASDGTISTFAHLPHNQPGLGLERDAAGNLYVPAWDYRVYRIDAVTHALSVFAGNGSYSFSGDNGPATAAALAAPSDVAFDAAGDAYISDSANHRIRRVNAATGVITTYAGTYNGNVLGDGGPATLATFRSPKVIEFDPSGNLVIADGQNCRLRQVNYASGLITTIAGNGLCTSFAEGDGGLATAASIGTYPAFAFDPVGNIYIAYSNQLRRVDAKTGIISSVIPPGGLKTPEGMAFTWPIAMKFDSGGRLYLGDRMEGVVFRISGLPYQKRDTTPPVIEPHITGTLGTNGWYRSDIAITWSVTDAESSVTWSNGCDAATVTQDTNSVSFRCAATSEGGTAEKLVTLRRDATPPSLSFGSAVPQAGPIGWYNSAVSVPFTTQDATSGVVSTSRTSPVIVSGEGAGLRATVEVVDRAGNSAEFTTPAFNIDRTPPVVEAVIGGTPGNNGWYRSDVAVSWSVDEIPASIQGSTGCESSSVTADTQGVTFTCSVTSAGGATSRSVTVKRDATPPVLTFGTPSPAPNANGWNKTNVSIPFTRSDALSGVASTSAASPLVLSIEGAGVTGQVVVTDGAGNIATFTSVARNIDKAAPIIAFTSPAEGATYGFYQDVLADYTCDDVSLVSCSAPTPNGELINTRTAGARTFKVTGKDGVNFTTAVTHSFSVESSFNFEGFLAPVNAPSTLNLVSRGALVPVRWRLPDGHGGFVSNPASFASATVGSLSCGSAPAVPLGDTASGAAGLSFDAATGTFTYNWATNASWTGCRKLTIKLRDNSVHELRFKLQ